MVCLLFASICFACFVLSDEAYIKDLEIRAANGDADAQFSLGKVYDQGTRELLNQNYVSINEWLGKLVIMGISPGVTGARNVHLKGLL